MLVLGNVFVWVMLPKTSSTFRTTSITRLRKMAEDIALGKRSVNLSFNTHILHRNCNYHLYVSHIGYSSFLIYYVIV